VHESQALLAEMIIGRTKAFFSFLSPRVEGLFHGLHNPIFAADNLDRIKTRVQPGLIRSRADEITYFYHVLLRFRLEKDLVEGSLKVADLPDAWNNGMEEMLGIRPQKNEEGCMQDVHWFVGKFGYFPSYTTGHMIAAQLWQKILEIYPKSCEKIAQGNFEELRGWLKENIHGKGRLYSAPELIRNVTGKPLGPEALLKHIKVRYLQEAA